MRNIINAIIMAAIACCAYSMASPTVTTGLNARDERFKTLWAMTARYGEPSRVGITSEYDFLTPEKDTIREIYNIITNNSRRWYEIVRYEWFLSNGDTITCYFPSVDPDARLLGKFENIKRHPRLFQYSTYHRCRVAWDTVCKDPEWISFKYLKEKDMTPAEISRIYGKPYVATGKKLESHFYFSDQALEGMYSQSIAKYPLDKLVEYVWKTDSAHYLRMFYAPEYNGYKPLTGCYQYIWLLGE